MCEDQVEAKLEGKEVIRGEDRGPSVEPQAHVLAVRGLARSSRESCQICEGEFIRAAEMLIRCTRCRAPYHDDCGMPGWHCSVPNCRGRLRIQGQSTGERGSGASKALWSLARLLLAVVVSFWTFWFWSRAWSEFMAGSAEAVSKQGARAIIHYAHDPFYFCLHIFKQFMFGFCPLLVFGPLLLISPVSTKEELDADSAAETPRAEPPKKENPKADEVAVEELGVEEPGVELGGLAIKVGPKKAAIGDSSCPFCREEFETLGAGRIRCPACQTPYHKDCAEELKVCAALGCEGVLFRPRTVVKKFPVASVREVKAEPVTWGEVFQTAFVFILVGVLFYAGTMSLGDPYEFFVDGRFTISVRGDMIPTSLGPIRYKYELVTVSRETHAGAYFSRILLWLASGLPFLLCSIGLYERVRE